jgi:hypothetical protein
VLALQHLQEHGGVFDNYVLGQPRLTSAIITVPAASAVISHTQ